MGHFPTICEALGNGSESRKKFSIRMNKRKKYRIGTRKRTNERSIEEKCGDLMAIHHIFTSTIHTYQIQTKQFTSEYTLSSKISNQTIFCIFLPLAMWAEQNHTSDESNHTLQMNINSQRKESTMNKNRFPVNKKQKYITIISRVSSWSITEINQNRSFYAN